LLLLLFVLPILLYISCDLSLWFVLVFLSLIYCFL